MQDQYNLIKCGEQREMLPMCADNCASQMHKAVLHVLAVIAALLEVMRRSAGVGLSAPPTA
jgi:hypothetical protein